MNDLSVWQENFKTTKILAWMFFFASILSFFVAGIVSYVMTEVGLLTLIANQKYLIATVTFGIITFGCWFARDDLAQKDISQMGDEEKEKHIVILHQLRGITIFFFFMFGISFASDDLSWPNFWDNRAAIVLVSCGVIMLALTMLANNMAKQIKQKYLTQPH